MKIFKLLFVNVLIIFSSCSENNGDKTLESLIPSGPNGGSSNTGNIDYAPEALKAGQCVNWWGSQIFNGDKYAEADKNNPNAIQILNGTDHQPFWYSDWGTYQYKKTGKNSATLYIIAPRHLNGGVVQTFSYSMNLSFYNATSFKMTGSLTVWHSLNGTTYRTLECYGVLNNSHGSSGFSEKESNTNGNNNSMGGSNENVIKYESVDLGLSVKWATCNVGASTPEGYGDYYSWGEVIVKTAHTWGNYKLCNGSANSLTKYCSSASWGIIDNKYILEGEDDVAQIRWGGSWRMPTAVEFQELQNKCIWNFATKNGVYGYFVQSKINGNSIFLPLAGRRVGGIDYRGESGHYWTSSYSHSYLSKNVLFSSKKVELTTDYRAAALSIRPVCSK